MVGSRGYSTVCMALRFGFSGGEIVVALTGKSHSAALGTIPQDPRSWAGAKSGNNNDIVLPATMPTLHKPHEKPATQLTLFSLC